MPVSLCFLELADPDLATGLNQAAEDVGAGGEVVVLPLFLGSANHEKNDVAASIQWARSQFPNINFRYAKPLGPHANLIELQDLRVREALAGNPDALPAEESGVLLVGRGSSDPYSNSEIARTARLLFENRPYRSVEVAYQAVARPTVAEGIRRVRLLGARQVVVAPYILFTGRVEEDILAVSQQAAQAEGLHWLAARPLGVHPLLVKVAEQRVAEALEGSLPLTCDLCKYRLPMAGYLDQLGQQQHTHHLYGGTQHQHNHDHNHEDHHHDHPLTH